MQKPFVKAASVALDGKDGGCEVLFNASIVIGVHDGVNQYVVPENLSIVLAKPRRLVVLLRTSCFQCAAICLHAQDSSWSCDEIEIW